MDKTLHTFTIGRVDGCWLAVSTHEPYFCLEAKTQEEAIAIANRALEFYFGQPGSVTVDNAQPKGRPKTLRTFHPTRKIERERVAA